MQCLDGASTSIQCYFKADAAKHLHCIKKFYYLNGVHGTGEVKMGSPPTHGVVSVDCDVGLKPSIPVVVDFYGRGLDGHEKGQQQYR